jgi:hypothetical protein
VILKKSRTKPRIQNSASGPAQPIPVLVDRKQLKTLQSNSGLLTQAWRWIRSFQLGRPEKKRLQVSATASLGEKRFVAVIQIDGREFLIGGGATSVALLAQLNGKESFGEVLRKTLTAPKKRIAKPSIERTSVHA